MPSEFKIGGCIMIIMTVLCIYGCTQDQKKIHHWHQSCYAQGGEPMSGKGNYPYCLIDGKIVDMRASP
ncbi:hypothetical protein [Stenotrophomonas phage YB07]|uniref:Uncharacterized protein n=1 Tax=Stenotrophomonas phage YB07 TaxID=2555548 RepID=A0A482IET8_9CAUD|nr:hypothetical protein HWC11_gp231 [Stenotrophomonas phage YB07]QBP06427.1 hypothetical protein [Stenotrophomonas phage YB07]